MRTKFLLVIIIYIIILFDIKLLNAEKNAPPVPPPPVSSSSSIPFSETYYRDPQEKQKIEDITDIYEIPEETLHEFLKKRDKILPYIRDYKNLNIMPFQTQYLSMTNIFYYTPSLPVLIKVPFKIKHVILTDPGGSIQKQESGQGKQSVHSVYEDQFLVVFPPPPATDIWSFIVVSEDNKPFYFYGERSTNLNYKGNKLVVPYISYIEKPKIDDKKILILFYKKFKRCPIHGETIEINGYMYRIVVKDATIMIQPNQISFCEKVYEIERL